MVRIDLGCGTNKQLGFIGVDRYALPGVDVLVNLDEPLPFPNDSVDLTFASHSLEHAKNLLATMQEIYRISKHGAQLCVLAPYSEQKLNLANPYHAWQFNEHTPRFWTSYSKAPIEPEEFAYQFADQWGLSTSDNSNPGIDIRLGRMEFFYFPPYVLFPVSEQRRLRQQRMDVCDQILYHLIVWKGDERSPAKSFDAYLNELQPYEPKSLSLLRQRGSEALLKKQTVELEESHSRLADLDRQLVEVSASAGRDRDQAIVELEESNSRLEDLGRQLAELRASAGHDRDQAIADAAILTNELTLLRLVKANEQSGAKEEIQELRTHLLNLTGELTRLTKTCVDQTGVIRGMATELKDAEAYNRVLRDEAARTGRELEFARADLRRESAKLTASEEEASSLWEERRALRTSLESQEVLSAKLAVTKAELEATAALLTLGRQKVESLDAKVAEATRKSATYSQEAERWKALYAVARQSLGSLHDEIRILSPAMVRVAGFFIARHRKPDRLNDAFVPLRDFSDMNFGARSASLVLSGDLNQVPYCEYTIPFDWDGLKSISLAIRPLMPGSSGSVGIEIVSSESEILAHTLLSLDTIQATEITEFRLPVPLALKKPWLLRVFVRGADAPVLVYELARGAIFRAVTQIFPFVSLK